MAFSPPLSSGDKRTQHAGISAIKALANKHPVTWQPSVDGTRLIGHMVLHRHPAGSKGDLGFKVVGGRRVGPDGRFGAFITRVKKNSVADIIGHLKTNDEVLEWNSRSLQGATFEEVYEIINDSRHDPHVDLIVSRPIHPGGTTDPALMQVGAQQMQGGGLVGGLESLNLQSASQQAALQQQQQMQMSGQQPIMSVPSGLPANALPGAPGVLATSYQHGTSPGGGAPVVMVTGPMNPNVPPPAGYGLPGPHHPGVSPAVSMGGIPMSQSAMLGMGPEAGPGGMFTRVGPRGHIFGRIQLSLYYAHIEQQMVVTVHQAMDLPPRADGTPRNPYVKMFLLPDRSEKSRRQSKVLVGTCLPIWQQPFIYQGLTQQHLLARVLEVTLWDYDKYGTNEFLGEVLIDLAACALGNEPCWFHLTEMDEDSPLRMIGLIEFPRKVLCRDSLSPVHPILLIHPTYDPCVELRMRRVTPVRNHNGEIQNKFLDKVRQQRSSAYMGSRSGRDIVDSHVGAGYPSFGSDSGIDIGRGMPRSQTYHRPRHPQAVRQDDDPYSGYYSDHAYSSRSSGPYRRPRSATAMIRTRDLRPASPTQAFDPVRGGYNRDWQRNLPQIPTDLYGEEAMKDLRDKADMLRSQREAGGGHHQRYSPSSGVQQQQHQPRRAQYQPNRPHGPRPLPTDPNSPPTDPNFPYPAGYMSDGSETSMSVRSTQSERPPRTNQQRRPMENFHQPNSLDPAPEEEMEDHRIMGDAQDGTMSDSALDRYADERYVERYLAREELRRQRRAERQAAEEKRKKSLMTRLIPGKSQTGHAEAKRTGFTRSEEVGVPPSLSPQSSLEIVKQTSKESTDSSDSWLPVIADGPLGDFVSDLGPGQVVGRQVLASPCLGEIQLGISDKRGNIEVEIIRAKALALKPGAKVNPAPYVKVYLMDSKVCVAKAKTSITRKTLDPLFNQTLYFAEPYQDRMLQVTVWGDYGRMERKVFMGIAQIRLDNLNLSNPVIGWYKLFHSNSLVGTGSPARKDSETSLQDDPKQQSHRSKGSSNRK